MVLGLFDQGFHLPAHLSLWKAAYACDLRKISMGGRFNNASIAAVGVEGKAPVIVIHANRWSLSNLVQTVCLSRAAAHTWHPYTSTGLTTAVYNQYIILSLRPHVREAILLHTISANVAFLSPYFMCAIHFSLLSRITPRHLTSFTIGSLLPFSVSGSNLHFLLRVKIITPHFFGLMSKPHACVQ